MVGLTNGLSIVEITDPANPVFRGKLPTVTGNRAWRDIKVYKDHAFIVSDVNGAHGMQVFNLNKIVVPKLNALFLQADANFHGFTTCHNIVINEDTGYAYAVGSSEAQGGLYLIDINSPTNPVYL